MALDPLTAILNIGGQLIDKLIPDPAAKAQAQFQLMQLEQNGQLEEMKTSMSAIVAEASSTDPWTSRARPSFMYVMYILILVCIPMGMLDAWHPEVALAVTNGMTGYLKAIPDSLYQLFGVGYLGYAGGRTIEKIKGAA